MTPDVWAIVGTRIALAALILTSFRSLRTDLTHLKADIKALDNRVRDHGERMAKLEGLLEAVSGRRVA